GCGREWSADSLARVDDSAAGYPGLQGWGAKSAAAVLARFKHLESIPDDWQTWSVNARNAAGLSRTLNENRDLALLFRRLATLKIDVPLFTSVDALKWNGPTPAFEAVAAKVGGKIVRPS